jgi:hypothetical protein
VKCIIATLDIVYVNFIENMQNEVISVEKKTGNLSIIKARQKL